MGWCCVICGYIFVISIILNGEELRNTWMKFSPPSNDPVPFQVGMNIILKIFLLATTFTCYFRSLGINLSKFCMCYANSFISAGLDFLYIMNQRKSVVMQISLALTLLGISISMIENCCMKSVNNHKPGSQKYEAIKA
ncbi:uncharacterized protein LOC120338459 [Styela clava]